MTGKNRPKRRRQRTRSAAALSAPRRGVLLLVVLSMLVLFLLIGTTFLITSGQYRTQMKVADQAVRSTFQPADLLERALMQLVRDTNNTNSVIRHHSLLRDLYGVDGFVGRITMNGPDGTFSVTRDGSLGLINYGGVTGERIMPRYAGFNPAAAVGVNNPVLGATQGQLIEFYVADVAVGADGDSARLSDHNAVGLDFDANGIPVEHAMSPVDGYYDGSLLTMLEGPCAGQTVRVVSYDHVYSNQTNEGGGTTQIVVSRWRVMAPKRADGQALKLGVLPGAAGPVGLTDFVDGTDLGYRFMVNGRPFNGAGVGFNPLALSHDFLNGGVPSPRLSAVERLPNTPNYAMEVALAPNASQFFVDQVNHLQPQAAIDPFAEGIPNAGYVTLNEGRANPLYRTFAGPGDTDESYDAPDTQNMALASQSLQPRLRGRVVNAAGVSLDPDAYYPAGAGTAPAYLDLEGVTIPSFHRPALANFWFHRLFDSGWLSGVNPAERVRAILSPYDRNGAPRTGLNPDQASQIAAIKRKFMLRPLREDHPDFDGSNPLSTYSTSAIQAVLGDGMDSNIDSLVNSDTGEITFPYWEAVGPWDVDNDADGVPDSVWVDVGLPVQQTEDGRLYKPLVAMLVEDLDGRLNLNVHGTGQDVVGNSTLADPFASSLLDGSTGTPGSNRRNLAQDYVNNRPLQSSNQLPTGNGWGVAETSLRSILSPTLPVDDQLNTTPFDFQANPQYDDYARLLGGRPDPTAAGRTVVDALKGTVTFGRYGSSLITGLETTDRNGNQLPVNLTAPGRTHVANTPTLPIASTRDPRTALEFLGYPDYLGQLEQPSGFSSTPDLSGRYSNGLSAAGGAINEANSDRILSGPGFLNRIVPVTHDSPYELDVSSAARRLAPVSAEAVRLSYDSDSDDQVDGAPSPLNDDAPFSPAELERLLRAFDGDADKLPDRLWEIVDSFDPDKLAAQQLINNAIRAGAPNPVNSPAAATSRQNVSAAIDAAVNRRAVTTDSFDLPVPNENWGSRLALGADGLPGVPRFNDDNPTGAAGGDQLVDEGDEAVVGYDPVNRQHQFAAAIAPVNYDQLFRDGCDDYVVVMREDPPTSPRITDFLRYRITLELLNNEVIDENDLFTPATRPATLRLVQQHINNILVGVNNRPASRVAASDLGTQPALYSYGGLLAPELMAGLRMNLNRPFGDGRDNNDNGVVDEPQEAGEPFVDANGNGVWDTGEAYLNLDGSYNDANGNNVRDPGENETFTPSLDQIWVDADNDGIRDPGEEKPFGYTRGADANGRGMFVDGNANGRYDRGETLIQDDARTARQLYARHLYCLMLALMDENYLAPYDSNDPQVVHYVNVLSGTFDRGSGWPGAESSTAYWLAIELFAQEFRAEIASGTLLSSDVITPPNDGNLATGGRLVGDHTHPLIDAGEELRRLNVLAEARRLALRKLTCRRIAQWAINVVDFRDPDAIQTPFEYDENPWDGWNVVDTQGTNDDASDDLVYPLDGDLSTDENFTQLRLVDATGFSNPGVAIDTSVLPQLDTNNFTTLPEDLSLSNQITPGVANDPVPRRVILLDRTRGVVWGAERPEAILTEGLAWHDRRLEDLEITRTTRNDVPTPPGSDPLDGGRVNGGADDDLDQLRKPKGYVYLEAMNPWIDGEQRPSEFYSHVDRDGTLVPFDGIRFDRLSNIPANPSGALNNVDKPFNEQTRSPVWRLAVVEEHPVIRNASVSKNLLESISATLGTGPINDLPAVSDDPANRLNRTENVQGAFDYLGIDLSGLPSVYPAPTLPNVTEETATEYGNIDSAQELAPVMQRAYADLWFDKAVKAFLGFATTSNQLQNGVGDADGLRVSVGIIEEPPRMADPSFPTFDRFAQPTSPARSEFRLSSRLEGRQVAFEEIDNEDYPINAIDRTILLKPTRFIERVFYMASPNAAVGTANAFGGVDEDNLSGNRTQSREPYPRLNNPGFRYPELTYELPVLSDLNRRDLNRPDIGIEYVGPAPGDFAPGGLAEEPSGLSLRVHISKFASIDLLRPGVPQIVENPNNPNDPILQAATAPIELAPLLPGRRAVIGTAGAVYDYGDPDIYADPGNLNPPVATFTGEDSKELERRFTVLSSQLHSSATSNGANAGEELLNPVPGVTTEQRTQLRRFEMIPSRDAAKHQFAVRMNGFTDSQTAEFADGSPLNVTVGPELALAARPVAPVIAVPIDSFSISEPIDQYFVRQIELDPELDRLYEPNLTGQRTSERPAEGYFADAEGQLPFDEPFDLLPELIENQTTPNYRAMHLERLANPLIPWNPPPMLVTGDPNPQHVPTLPVNPYLPVDAQALDITAFNGFSDQESGVGEVGSSTAAAHKPTVVSGGGSAQGYGPASRHRRERPIINDDTAIGFSSNERDRPLGAFRFLWNFQPARLLWKQGQGATVSELLSQNQNNGYTVDDGDNVTDGGDALNPRPDQVGDYTLEYDQTQLGTNYEQHMVDFPWRMTLGFPSWLSGEFHIGGALRWIGEATADLTNAHNIDLDSDGVTGDVLGAAEVNDAPVVIGNDGRPTNAESLGEASTTPGFAWPNRPFASAGELLQVPAWGGSRMLSYYSTFNWLHTQMPGFLHDTQINPYNGEAGVDHDGQDYTLNNLVAGGPTFNGDYADERPEDTDGIFHDGATNDLRFRETLGHFGHLLNFFQTARFPSHAARAEGGETQRGAAHFYRVLDYVHVPSRFVATDTLLSPDVFGDANIHADDPRAALAAPFNRVNRYREPGRVNLNTIVGRRDVNEATRTNLTNGAGNGRNPADAGDDDAGFSASASFPRLGDSWSEVYDGLMHRVKDASLLDYNATNPKDSLVEMGHLGPAWRDVVLSRRGYVQSTFDPTIDPSDASFTLAGSAQNQVDYSSRRLHPAFPTFFANPFRAPGEGANVPLAHMVQTGVDATMLRAHPLSPGADGAWGRRGADDFTVKKDQAAGSVANLNGIRDDADEAGTLTLTIGGGATAGNVRDRLNADVVLSRFDSAGRRGSLPDTFLDNAFKVIPADPNSRDLSPGASIAAGIRNTEISKRATPVPLFSGATLEPSLDTERNSTTRYQPIQRMASLATTRSNVYAAWITIGFFEVKPAREDARVFGRYMTDTDGDGIGDIFTDIGGDGGQASREAFFRTYPDGWMLGQELDLDIGQNQRHRGFYVIDRSRPVAFRPGEDANVAETILLRRRIE